MVRFLLDTNVISEAAYTRPNQGVVEQINKNEAAIAISSTVLHEIMYGYDRLPDSKRKDVLGQYIEKTVLNSVPILPYGDSAAKWHSSERARLESIGRKPGYADGQIAAVAAVNGLTLVTRNVSDFSSFEGLRVVNWHQEEE